MSSIIKNVMIIGTSGHLGSSMLSAFVADKRFAVSVLARNSSKSAFSLDVKVYRISDEYPESELLDAFKDQDTIISTIATEIIPHQKAIIDTAIKAGVKRFVPSEFGGDNPNENAIAVIPQYFKGKLQTVEYLKEKEKEGLTWTSFVTGLFFDLGLKAGYMGFNVKENKAIIYNDGNTPFSTTTLNTIALAVKNAMLVPEKTANKYMYIASFTVTQNQVLKSLEKSTGQKWEVTQVDGEEQKKIGLEKMSKGDLSGAPLLIRYINYVEAHGGNYAEYKESANDLLSLPKQTLDETIADVLKN